MEIITSREFRENQAKYLDKVDEGLKIVVMRGKNRSYTISPITKDHTLMSQEQLVKKIKSGLKQIEQGKFIRVSTKEELKSLLDSL